MLVHCMFCLPILGFVIFTQKNFFLSSLVPFYENELLSYNSRIYNSFQLLSSNKELFQVREGN